jgi:AI-2 transport protein TqsA
VLLFIFTLFLLSGRNPRKLNEGFYAEIDHRIRRYINIKVALSAATGVLVGFSLSLIGLESAIVFGVMAFLLNFIPALGSIVSTFVPIPLALAQFVAGQDNPNYLAVALVLLIPGAIQMTIGNFLEPKLMGEGFQLHPVVVIMALSFWGILWGPAGMVLAIPITAIMRILLTHFETTHPIAEILAGNLPQPPAYREQVHLSGASVSPRVELPASRGKAGRKKRR